eukprot:scaffold65866_cov26-Prasinocladus_malaysianus.AAC.1
MTVSQPASDERPINKTWKGGNGHDDVNGRMALSVSDDAAFLNVLSISLRHENLENDTDTTAHSVSR